ncbi:MAG: carboxylesterase family protein [Robiginitomaculum sp.]|nr:carboxylesterase family protein [Robiginitomaculum sp.]
MKNWLALVLATGLLAACGQKSAPSFTEIQDDVTLRQTANGPVVGSITNLGAHRWGGIPFAQPPIDDLRWRAPRQPTHWDGVFAALDTSSRCVQTARRSDVEKNGTFLGAEDCLHLNIWAPAFSPEAVPASDEKLPVMFFIHGGSNTWGFGGQYNSEALATRHNMVVVTINYRLGPLGWFSQPALRTGNENPMDNSPNFANLDMIMALKWVQNNIGSFGGNPNRVTIFGESAGAHNVASLLAIPQAQGLFHGAISQSGYFTSRSMQSDQQGVAPEDGWEFPGSNAVVAKLNPPANATLAEMAVFLRAQSAQALFDAAVADDGDTATPLIIRDGILIPTEGLEYALTHAPHKIVPLITGANRDEVKLFNLGDPDLTKKAFGFLPRARDRDFYDLMSKHPSQMWRVRAVDDQARRITARAENPVFGYRFDWDEQGSFLGSDFAHLIGAAHAMELPFVFDGFATFPIGGERIFPKSGAAERDELSQAMMSYWAEFAHTGAPGKGRDGTLPLWESWGAADGDGQFMVLDTASSGGLSLSQDVLTPDAVYARLGQSVQHLSPEDKCIMLIDVMGWFPETREHASAANIKGC